MARDRRLKAAQALLTRATIPILRVGDKALRQAPVNHKQMLDDALDSTLLMAAASASITGIRRDAVRQRLGYRGKQICPEDIANANPLVTWG